MKEHKKYSKKLFLNNIKYFFYTKNHFYNKQKPEITSNQQKQTLFN